MNSCTIHLDNQDRFKVTVLYCKPKMLIDSLAHSFKVQISESFNNIDTGSIISEASNDLSEATGVTLDTGVQTRGVSSNVVSGVLTWKLVPKEEKSI